MTNNYSAAPIILIRHHEPVGPVDQVEHKEGQGEQVEEDGVNVGHLLPPLNLIHFLQPLQGLFLKISRNLYNHGYLFYLWRVVHLAVIAVDYV